ncbi:putative uncharacterized protein [Parachlamydia acanthamoebae UV-7]|uniref:Uncharacterized protein n=2 Tax=Parachlamydia acanthamoebae TaxID=83552 RepID=F8L1H1_PARAV|nr:hypothetical protein [Parachlamydia acanthamoebae]KIA77162.1 hypothetical protein DB43_GT00030 [Parachlamydia acanthamoebae]CCB87113.1 putative uncharacterized protein [Parachlamydia acanthamoebae UV-7]
MQKRGQSDEIIASLDIDFFENRLCTYFQGEEKSIKLSVALGIIQDLSEIFAKIQSSTIHSETEKLPPLKDQPTNALDATSDAKLDGNEMIKFYSLTGRVVLSTSQRESSTPIELIQNCAHLFNQEFAKNVCPLLSLDLNLNDLLNGIRNLYLGRCILGLGKSIAIQSRTQLGLQRDFVRIVNLIKVPGSASYSRPLQ